MYKLFKRCLFFRLSIMDNNITLYTDCYIHVFKIPNTVCHFSKTILFEIKFNNYTKNNK